MANVGGEEWLGLNNGAGGNEAIRHLHAVGQMKFLHPSIGPMSDFRRKIDHFNFVIHEEPAKKTVFLSVPAALHEFHPGDDGYFSLILLLDGRRRLGVSPQTPDQDIRINQHGIGAFANAPLLRKPVLPDLSTSPPPDGSPWEAGGNFSEQE